MILSNPVPRDIFLKLAVSPQIIGFIGFLWLTINLPRVDADGVGACVSDGGGGETELKLKKT